jgi:hypothetical protein
MIDQRKHVFSTCRKVVSPKLSHCEQLTELVIHLSHPSKLVRIPFSHSIVENWCGFPFSKLLP